MNKENKVYYIDVGNLSLEEIEKKLNEYIKLWNSEYIILKKEEQKDSAFKIDWSIL